MRAWIQRLFGRIADRPLDCHHVGEVLQHYLDGQLDAATARRIEAHLELCRRCGMELETYRLIKATLVAHRAEVPAESIARLREFAARIARGEEPSTP